MDDCDPQCNGSNRNGPNNASSLEHHGHLFWNRSACGTVVPGTVRAAAHRIVITYIS